MNTAIYSPSGTSAGIGFAIPVDIVNRVVPELIRFGRVTRPGIGIQLVDDQIAQELGAPGPIVYEVAPGSAAARAGIRPTRRDPTGRVRLGDVLVSVDGKKVTSANDLFLALEEHKVGDTVTVGLLRNGKQEHVRVTLEAVR